MGKEKPQAVREAIARGDIAALRRMGRAGGRTPKACKRTSPTTTKELWDEAQELRAPDREAEALAIAAERRDDELPDP